MKKIITLTLLILSCSNLLAQDVTYSAYIPMRTYHFCRCETTMADFHPTEGGNLGVIIGRRVQQNEKVYTEKNLGVIRNSYGATSVVLQQGLGTTLFKEVEITGHVGFASGYGHLYDINTKIKQMPAIFQNNGVIITITLAVSPAKSLSLGKGIGVTPLIVISPFFVNGGVKVMLK